MITSDRRYEIKMAVLEALKYSKPKLPVPINKIINNIPNIITVPYSYEINTFGISYSQMITASDTKDSFASYSFSSDKYIIYFNNLDKNIMESNRYRWNLAHELGHCLLKHHHFVKKEKLFRTNIDNKKYSVFEEEADYFAQLILVPHIELRLYNVSYPWQIAKLCKISTAAAVKRFYPFKSWNSKKELELYDKVIEFYYFFISHRVKCTNCNKIFLLRYGGNYCVFCGSKNTIIRSGEEMIYDELDVHENNKLKICPVCKNEQTAIDGYFCQICGSCLANICETIGCKMHSKILSSNYRYCPVCGEQTSFFKKNYLKAWNFSDQSVTSFFEFDEELPFN